MAKFVIKFNFDEFAKELNKEVAARLNQVVLAARERASAVVRSVIDKYYTASPEYQALLPGGELYHELGLRNSRLLLTQLLIKLLSQVKVQVIPREPISILRVFIFDGDVDDLTYEDYAEYTSEGGYDVPWLEWLLMSGGQPVIADYTYVPKSIPASRTGLGYMNPEKYTRGVFEPYSVSAQYVGTESDNWITRVFRAAEEEIFTSIENLFIEIHNGL